MTTELADRAVGVGLPELDAPDAGLSEEDQEKQLAEERWAALNPCHVCEANQVESPEREARTALHCFRCGFRPGQTVGLDVARPAVSPDVLNQAIAQMRRDVVADILEALQSGQIPTVSHVPPAAAPAAQGTAQAAPVTGQA